MEVVDKGSVPPGRKAIDYASIAAHYNDLKVEGALRLEKVYNISLFKNRLEQRGVKSTVDFLAYSDGPHTYIKRLTTKNMKKD